MDGQPRVVPQRSDFRGQRSQGKGEGRASPRAHTYRIITQLFNAGLGGNKWRAIDIYENDRVDEAAMKDLIRDAVAFNLYRQ